MQSALTSVLEMARLRHNDPDAPVSRDEMTSMMACISNLLAPMNQDAMNALLQVGENVANMGSLLTQLSVQSLFCALVKHTPALL